MINVDIPKFMWLKILAAIIKLINRTATRIFSNMTLYETFIDQIELNKKG